MDAACNGSDRGDGWGQQLRLMLNQIEASEVTYGPAWRRHLSREYVVLFRALRNGAFNSDPETLGRIRRLTTRDQTIRDS